MSIILHSQSTGSILFSVVETFHFSARQLYSIEHKRAAFFLVPNCPYLEVVPLRSLHGWRQTSNAVRISSISHQDKRLHKEFHSILHRRWRLSTMSKWVTHSYWLVLVSNFAAPLDRPSHSSIRRINFNLPIGGCNARIWEYGESCLGRFREGCMKTSLLDASNVSLGKEMQMNMNS